MANPRRESVEACSDECGLRRDQGQIDGLHDTGGPTTPRTEMVWFPSRSVSGKVLEMMSEVGVWQFDPFFLGVGMKRRPIVSRSSRSPMDHVDRLVEHDVDDAPRLHVHPPVNRVDGSTWMRCSPSNRTRSRAASRDRSAQTWP